ncbi:hypothetical protein BDW42DRAFT_160316 [Aspergillus taichungensis]|uniref:Uncharacterized protein n=1 Tax=Aspergillus taichungensis TaxID=482145 RepID=A0A2J5I6R2_9EURO|nr:hypothetical protein BDW42DRAFT_160316 [Aspergillus taichungensis]
MKFTNSIAIAGIACSGMLPTVSAILGTSCLSALKAASQVPELFIEHLQREACSVGCEPTMKQWQHALKNQIIGELVEDGTAFCDAPEAKDAIADFLEDLMLGTGEACNHKLENKHLCHDPESVEPFVTCVRSKAQSSVTKSAPRLFQYMSEARCRKAEEYFTGDQLWEKDFPEHIQEYLSVCRDL